MAAYYGRKVVRIAIPWFDLMKYGSFSLIMYAIVIWVNPADLAVRIFSQMATGAADLRHLDRDIRSGDSRFAAEGCRQAAWQELSVHHADRRRIQSCWRRFEAPQKGRRLVCARLGSGRFNHPFLREGAQIPCVSISCLFFLRRLYLLVAPDARLTDR